MIKIVTANLTTGCLNLSQEYLNWLQKNGMPDASCDSFDNERSNPLLIACVEAVAAKMLRYVEKANELEEQLYELVEEALPDSRVVWEKSEQLIEKLKAQSWERNACSPQIGYLAEQAIKQRLSWLDARALILEHFQAGEVIDDLKADYEAILEARNVPSILNADKIRSEIETLVARYGFRRNDDNPDEWCWENPYSVEEYDEDKFIPRIIPRFQDWFNYETMQKERSEWEELILMPIVD